jgi:cytochrome c-type biogenesis protein CcmH
MSLFLALAASMSAMALVLVMRALMRGTPRRVAVSRRAANAAIHAAELDLLDRESSDGRITAEAHEAARDEVLRRVLADGADEEATLRAADRWPAAAITLAAPFVAVALYLMVGNPGAIEASTAATSGSISVSQLEEHLRYAPRDGRAWVALARLHMNAARYEAAAQAYEQSLASTAKIAGDADIWCELADALGMAQGGTLAGRPRALIEKALALKPTNPRALEMAGSAAYEAGDYAQTIQHWTTLLRELPAESTARRELAAALSRVQSRLANAVESH